SHGLFAYAPVFLVALLGFVVMASRGEVGIATLIGVGTVLQLVVAAGYPDWYGGARRGPPAILPLLPLLVWPLPAGIDALSSLAGGALIAGVLGVSSLLFFALPLATFPFFPEHHANGLRDIAWFLAQDGVVAPNLGRVFGLVGLPSIIPFALIL